jgi:hypothetical protein
MSKAKPIAAIMQISQVTDVHCVPEVLAGVPVDDDMLNVSKGGLQEVPVHKLAT